MAWNFYFDESGHVENSAPFVIFGGIGIDAAIEETFLSEIKTLYRFCFGIPYEESFDLKGKSLFEKKKILWAKSKPQFSDEDRQHYAAQQRMMGGNSSVPVHLKRAAYGQAGLLFTEKIFDVLEKYNCQIFCSLLKYGIENPLRDPEMVRRNLKLTLNKGDENYVTALLKELEINIYNDVFYFTRNNNITNSNIYLDDNCDYKDPNAKLKSDEARLKHFDTA